MPPREGNDVGCSRMPAARANDMSPPLHSRFAAGAGQRFEFVFVSLDLAGLGHLVDQVRDEEAKTLLLLALQELVANLIALGGVVGFRRKLALEYLKHDSISAIADRAADFPGFHSEGNGCLTGHGTYVGNLAVGQDEIAGLHG